MTSTPSPIRIEIVEDATVARLVGADGRSERFHALWLRDACTCSVCRRQETGERLLDPQEISPDLTIVAASILAAGVIDLLFSDGHSTRLAVAAVLDPTIGRGERGERRAGDHRLWNGGRDESTATVERGALDEREGLQAWLDALWTDGIAVVRGVETTEVGMLGVAHLVGPVSPSNYGMTWAIDATVDPESAVDSESSLRVHTDLPYRRNPPGVQMMMSVSSTVAGGASTFVDGFAVAERLRRADADAWALLTTVAFAYVFERPGVAITGRFPMLGLDADGRYDRIRRAPDLVGSPIVDAERSAALYRALGMWSSGLDDPADQRTVRLDPGDLVAFDNRRILHGRSAFELGASGRRQLLGCYLDIDELISRRAVLRSTER